MTQAAAIGLLGAMFSGAASVFKNGQISDTGFYVAYLLLFACLAGSFLTSLSIAAEVLDRILEFMGVLIPAYFMAVSFSGGSITGICMYEAMMAAVFCVQWLSKSVFLTGVRVYVLLVLGSHVMKEPLLSKMTSLTEQAVEWGIKTMFGLILGLHVLEAMVLPYADSVRRSGAGSRCRSGGPDGIRFRCIDQKYHGSRRCDSFGTHCFSSGGKASYTCTVLSGGRSHHAAGV